MRMTTKLFKGIAKLFMGSVLLGTLVLASCADPVSMIDYNTKSNLTTSQKAYSIAVPIIEKYIEEGKAVCSSTEVVVEDNGYKKTVFNGLGFMTAEITEQLDAEIRAKVTEVLGDEAVQELDEAQTEQSRLEEVGSQAALSGSYQTHAGATNVSIIIRHYNHMWFWNYVDAKIAIYYTSGTVPVTATHIYYHPIANTDMIWKSGSSIHTTHYDSNYSMETIRYAMAYKTLNDWATAKKQSLRIGIQKFGEEKATETSIVRHDYNQ